jgi:hypothetical protein
LRLSPLPIGVSQVIGRSTNPSKLPKKVIICWSDGVQKEICEQAYIKAVLKDPIGPKTAIVFEIFKGSDVSVYLMNLP